MPIMSFICLLLCLCATAQDAPVLETNALLLRLDPQHGSLVAFTDKAHPHEHIATPDPTGLWSAALSDGRVITPQVARQFTCKKTGDSTLSLSWSAFDLAAAPDFKVTAAVSLDATKPIARWHIRVEGFKGAGLRAVHFPRITGLAQQENETLAVPVWMGERTRRARDLMNRDATSHRWDWEYPGLLSMQCLAFYGGNGSGIEFSTNDKTAQRKQFAVFGDGRGGLGLEAVHLPAASGGEDVYDAPCDVLLGAFQGDWFTAASDYRAWAQNQTWVRESRIKRGLTPDWLLKTGLWVWNRGRSPGVLAPAEALADSADVPVSVFWHWWHGCAYDAGFPEYLPPREGEESFRTALSEAQSRNIHALVYMNQRLWGMTTKSWTDEGAERYAVKAPDGRVVPENYNTFMKAPCASMCMGTEFWRNKYAGLAESAVLKLGVDGIYMDQACSSCACYDPSHGHPLGGGSYWMDGFRALQADIRRRCDATKPVALAGEGCGEAWLPYLDAMLSLQVSMERYAAPGEWEPIPFFHAVYHDCALFFGNYASLTRPPYDDLWPAETAPKNPLELLDRKFSTQFRLEQARAFAWGQEPTVANFQPSHLTDRKEEMDFVIRLTRLRTSCAKYLRDGVFLRPPAIDAPEVEIPMSRLSIYAGQQDAVKEFRKTEPMALASAWQAPDGALAVVAVNIGTEALPLHLALARPDYPLPERGTILRHTAEGATKLADFDGGRAEISADLAPSDAVVFEMKPLP
jgi:hypothetical protein